MTSRSNFCGEEPHTLPKTNDSGSGRMRACVVIWGKGGLVMIDDGAVLQCPLTVGADALSQKNCFVVVRHESILQLHVVHIFGYLA